MKVLKFLSEPRKIDNFILNMPEVAPASKSLSVQVGPPNQWEARRRRGFVRWWCWDWWLTTLTLRLLLGRFVVTRELEPRSLLCWSAPLPGGWPTTNNRFLTANELREKVPGLSSVSTHRVNQVLRIAGLQVWCSCEETFPDWGSEGEKTQVGSGSQDLDQEEVEEGSLVWWVSHRAVGLVASVAVWGGRRESLGTCRSWFFFTFLVDLCLWV